MTRRRLPAEEARTLILSHARDLFIEKGYDRTTMDDVCAATGMSKGNLYHHFKNKEILYKQLIAEHVKRFTDSWLESPGPALPPAEQLLAYAAHYGRDCENPLLQSAEEFVRSLKPDSDTLQDMQSMLARSGDTLRGIVEKGLASGTFLGAGTEPLAFAILSLLTGTSQLCLALPPMSGDEYADYHVRAVRLLLHGIEARR
ncbi:TetR/AcrR family transcriptional regulator [Saccharibacillus sp. CPCC 101409]|uniref:TetR/AcrR family transcriptional regulator n=1 Tax=Saccharibacillus sp. CPCC 101409 TaxID=3058041 RepID=UPI0026728513|nr:TetR/AcrR family transcriptional regulator [Saccharibacillus sp. CPCC 101409]MDO3411145.1 TetR/AcrR family transcriptional regulator [Saccharibacillus sp. CPCC 101409]